MRAAGIGPATPPWQRGALPLRHARDVGEPGDDPGSSVSKTDMRPVAPLPKGLVRACHGMPLPAKSAECRRAGRRCLRDAGQTGHPEYAACGFGMPNPYGHGMPCPYDWRAHEESNPLASEGSGVTGRFGSHSRSAPEGWWSRRESHPDLRVANAAHSCYAMAPVLEFWWRQAESHRRLDRATVA